jgi:hypothetical protein
MQNPLNNKLDCSCRSQPIDEERQHMTNPSAYRAQYDRMRRWYERFVALDQGRIHDMPSEYYLDEIYAFFMNCYHLKDWLRNDSSVATHVQQSVETHVNSNRSLRLCADICNSLKHLQLTSSRSGENPDFGKKQFSVSLGPGLPTTISLKYEVDTSSGPIDAFDLATECIGAWETFLTLNGLQ